MPADLFSLPRLHLRAERGSQKLAAEAHSENRFFFLQRLLDQPKLAAQKRIAILLVNAHRPAHDDESAGIRQRTGNSLAVIETNDLDRNVRGPEYLADSSGRLGADVL